jgi:hypothetical protein
MEDDPFFETHPVDGMWQSDAPMYGLTVTAASAADGSRLEGLTIDMLVDTRPLVVLLDEEAGPDAMCEVAYGFGDACVPCPDDAEPFCLPVRFDRGIAYEVPLELQAVSDPCAASTCECE